jgi:hypothetical protein
VWTNHKLHPASSNTASDRTRLSSAVNLRFLYFPLAHNLAGSGAARMGMGRTKKPHWELLTEQVQDVATSIRPYFRSKVSNETLAAAVRAGAFLQTSRDGYRWECLWHTSSGRRCQSTFSISPPHTEGEYDCVSLSRHWRKYHAWLVCLGHAACSK